MKGDFDYLKGRAETEAENSEVSSMSSYQSVDEGAISVLSMEQIRSMRLIQLTSNLPKGTGMELDSDTGSDSDIEDIKVKLPEESDNSEHHRHISKLEQSDDNIVQDVNLEEEDSKSVVVPVGAATSSYA
mgnify:CR=1 FL=1